MAFLANQTYDGPGEHAGIGRAVRLMASHAAFDFHRRVLIHEWPSHIAMALQAARLIGGHRLQRARFKRPVRIVAVDAGHRALGKPVSIGLLEARPNILVAGCA